MLASRQFTFVITIFSTQPTQMILEFARQHAFVLISEDTDFGELLAPAMHSHPLIRAVTHLRTHDPGRASRSFAGEPSRLHDDLTQGAIVVIERSRLRVRRLPLMLPIPEQREQ